MKKHLLFFFSFLLLLGCTKFGKNISITGFVRNPVTGEAYEGITVKLLRETLELPGGLKSVLTTTTNADGYFEIHHFGGYNHYELSAVPPGDKEIVGWYEDEIYVGVGRMNVEKGRYMHPIFYLVGYGLLNTNIQNVNCEGSSDQMQIRTKTLLDEDYGGWSPVVEGCYSYSSWAPSEVNEGYHYYEMKVTRPSGTSYVYDTVFVPANGTVTCELFY